MPMRVAVVGLGLMGASLALALGRSRPDLTLVGVDSDEATLRRALARGVVSAGSTDLTELPGAAVVFLAVPVAAMPELLLKLPPLAPGAVLTDLASTKARVMDWALAAGVELVGGHPMCGRELSGIDAADPDLYQGAAWILTSSQPLLQDLITAVGARPVIISARDHDVLVAGVSHAAFLVSVAYVLSLSGSPRWPEMAPLAGSGFRDMSRLAAGDPELYSGIVQTNREQVVASLQAVEASLARVRRHLDAGDPRLAELFEEAKAVRDRWRRDRDAGRG
jgi:prephenate dehydrogenase